MLQELFSCARCRHQLLAQHLQWKFRGWRDGGKKTENGKWLLFKHARSWVVLGDCFISRRKVAEGCDQHFLTFHNRNSQFLFSIDFLKNFPKSFLSKPFKLSQWACKVSKGGRKATMRNPSWFLSIYSRKKALVSWFIVVCRSVKEIWMLYVCLEPLENSIPLLCSAWNRKRNSYDSITYFRLSKLPFRFHSYEVRLCETFWIEKTFFRYWGKWVTNEKIFSFQLKLSEIFKAQKTSDPKRRRKLFNLNQVRGRFFTLEVWLMSAALTLPQVNFRDYSDIAFNLSFLSLISHVPV